MNNRLFFAITAATILLAASGQGYSQPRLEIFESDNLHCNDTVAVYSPSSEKNQKNLPTLILMHGYSGCWSDWGKHTDLQALCDKTGWRIICPDGFYSSWYLDNADKSKMQWRTFFWEECYPALNKAYGLDPEKTFTTGLSMGGHGAMSLFLDHPELFKGAGSMSGVLDLRYSSGSKELIADILGKKSVEKCDKESAVFRLENLAALGTNTVNSKILIVSCGTEDNTFYPASRLFEARCRELGIRVISCYRPGKHSWDFWTYMLPYYINFFEESLQ